MIRPIYDWTTRIYFTKFQLSAAAVKSVQHTTLVDVHGSR